MAPELEQSTSEERLAYIQETYRCISDCDSCGLCKVFHGKDPVMVYEDYISGKRSFREISEEYRRR